MKKLLCLLLLLLSFSLQCLAYTIWPSTPPKECPLAQSTLLSNIAFTGRYGYYPNTGADTWYPTWAADGNLYSPFTDGTVEGISCASYTGAQADTGNAIIYGDNPLNLTIKALSCTSESASPFAGRYPCGSLVYQGVWYYGTYALADINGPCGNWCVMGPFIGYRMSTDFGTTWNISEKVTGQNPLFETNINAKVKLGAPHFVDFGQELKYSPDGLAYVVGHGCTNPASNCSWISGDNIYLARVKPTPQTINDVSSWQFFGGFDNNFNPIWTSNYSAIEPLISWPTRTGVTTLTYYPLLGTYILVCTTPTVSPSTVGTFDTWLAESKSIEGPYKLISYMSKFGQQGYFVNFPSKFLSTNQSQLGGYLFYSADFTQNQIVAPPGGRYGLVTQEAVLLP